MVKSVSYQPKHFKTTLSILSCMALLFVASSTFALEADPSSVNGIVGTGDKDFSEVTPSGIVGTGNKDFSEVTPSGIVGTGNKDFSEVTPNGIVGTGVMSIDEQNSFDRFQIWAVQVNPAGPSLVLYGPVQGLDEANLTVLGQDISLNGLHTKFQVDVGEIVAVFGEPGKNGIDARKVLVIDESHVDGSSAVYLSGNVSTAQKRDGSFMVGNAVVQIGEAGADPSAYNINLNDFVTVTGVTIEGHVIADTVK